MTRPLQVIPVTGIGEIVAGDDVGAIIVSALADQQTPLADGDVLVVSSKVVSKARGLRHQLTDPADKPALVLDQTRRVVTERAGAHGITRVVHAVAGPVMAAAGIDASNTGPDGGVLLLPADPDEAARELHRQVLAAAESAPHIGVILSDTAGRPWRLGQSDFALGASGVAVLDDLRGGHDSDGRDLSVTARAVADQIASAADLVKGKIGGIAAAVVRGLPPGTLLDDSAEGRPPEGAARLVRTGPDDWFAHGRLEAVRSALGVDPGSPASEQVGVSALGPEPLAVRLQRAAALALHDPRVEDALAADPEAVRIDLNATEEQPEHTRAMARMILTATDPFLRGVVLARLEVALHSEALAGPLAHGLAGEVVVEAFET